MLARSSRLLYDIDLSERVFKYSCIVSIPPRVGYWVTYTLYVYYMLVYYILLTLLIKRKMP